MDRAVWEELWHATIAVLLLTALVSVIYIGLTDLPLQPFIIGELVGVPTGIAILTLAAPRRHR